MFVNVRVCMCVSGPSDAGSAKEQPKHSDSDHQTTSSKDNDVLSKVGTYHAFFALPIL